MKKVAAAMMALMFSIPSAMEAKEAHLMVFGSGAATDSDRAAAIARASDLAKAKVSSGCTGTVTTVEQTGTQCYGAPGKSPQTCIVLTRGVCQVELHKRHRRS
jgi:hypothetical protein